MTEDHRLRVDRTEAGSAVVLRVSGELDLTTAERIHEAVAADPRALVILELSRVTFLDSAGIRTIDLAVRALREEGRTLLVVAPPDSRAGWTLKIAGFGDGVVIESVEAASARGKP